MRVTINSPMSIPNFLGMGLILYAMNKSALVILQLIWNRLMYKQSKYIRSTSTLWLNQSRKGVSESFTPVLIHVQKIECIYSYTWSLTSRNSWKPLKDNNDIDKYLVKMWHVIPHFLRSFFIYHRLIKHFLKFSDPLEGYFETSQH